MMAAMRLRSVLRWAGLAALCLWAGDGSRAQGLTPQPENCTVEGTVVRATDGQPLRRARVQLIRVQEQRPGPPPGMPQVQAPRPPGRSPVALTDSQGRFTLTDVQPGRYRMYVERGGYVRAEYGQRYPNRPGTQLTLDRGQKVRELLFRMTPAAVISGRVTDEEGEPVPNAGVQALRQVYQRGQRTFANSASVSTDDRGEFRLFGLAPGKYYLSVSPSGQLLQLQAPMTRETGSPGEIYAVSFYPGATDPARAAPIQVAAGEELSQMNLTLTPQRAVRVRGKILTPPGWEPDAKGRGGLQAMLLRRGTGGGRGLNMQGDVEQDQMQFEFRNVTAGSYYLMVNASQERRWLNHVEPLEVGSTDVEGVTVAMRPPSEVSGKVRLEGATDVKLEGVRVMFLPELEMQGNPGGRVNAEGTFTAQNLSPDTFRVSVQGLPSEFYLKSVRVGAEEFVETGVPIPGKAGGQLEIVLSAASARVEGQVLDGDSLPVAGAYVALAPTAPKRRANWYYYKSTTTDAAGKFSIAGIAPGEYKLFSWDDVDSGAWQDPEFLALYEDRGMSVQLSENSIRAVELKLLPPR